MYFCLETPSDCPDPDAVENGQASPAEGPFCYGEEIVYTCNPGYKMEGNPVIECTDTSQFNKPIPSCVQDTSGRLSIHDFCLCSAECT